MDVKVRARFIDDGTRGGCLRAPTGRIAIRGEMFRKPCNNRDCRRCDAFRDALRDAQARNLVYTLKRDRRRILSGVRER